MHEFLFFLGGFIIAYAVCYFIVYEKFKSKQNAVITQLNKTINTEREQRIVAETRLFTFQENQKEQKTAQAEAFEALALRTVQQNNKVFLDLASQTVEQQLLRANGRFDSQKNDIENMIKPLNEALGRHELLTKELQKHSSENFGGLKTYLEELFRQQKSLERETASLVSALKAPKVRGRWGEIGLRRIIEFSGLNQYCHFAEQVSTDKNDNQLRPDLVVFLPENRKIVIDSKVPLNAYLDALEASDELLREALLKKHAQALGTHVKNLSTKAYWQQFDETVDFVVLYIEVEPAFGAALAQNTDLLLQAVENKVVLATPTTLITLLKTVAYTWKQHSATENAQKIWQASKELFDRLSVFTEHFSKLGNNLNSVVKTYNQAVGSWESRVSPTFKKIENLSGINKTQTENEFTTIETNLRELKPNENNNE